MAGPRKEKTSLRRLLDMLWQQPLWAVPFAVFFGTLYGATPQSYVLSYKLSLVFSYSIGVALWGVGVLLPRLRAGRAAFGEAFTIGLAYGLSTLLASYLAAIIIHFTLLPGFVGSLRAVLVTGMYATLFFALFGGIRFAIVYHRMAVDRAGAVEAIRAELAQAELRALRAQLHPHFLFNTLNSIASLIPSDPRAAEEVTTRLAELFRHVLRASEREHVPLAEELDFLRSYLAIERVRVGDRLRVEERIEPGLESLAVPSLLLQPLVENAVRYAVAPRVEGGTVRLEARREGERLVLEVGDDGPGLDGARAPSGTGFGLHSVRERLRAARLPDLEVHSEPGRGTRMRLSLPVLPMPSHPRPDSGGITCLL
jgi:two-component system LytT family sensor kinase